MNALFRALLGLTLFTLAAPPASANEAKGYRVALRGLVCTFCARGLQEVLGKQASVERFEIRVPRGDVLLWLKEMPERETQIARWIQASGLAVGDVTPLN